MATLLGIRFPALGLPSPRQIQNLCYQNKFQLLALLLLAVTGFALTFTPFGTPIVLLFPVLSGLAPIALAGVSALSGIAVWAGLKLIDWITKQIFIGVLLLQGYEEDDSAEDEYFKGKDNIIARGLLTEIAYDLMDLISHNKVYTAFVLLCVGLGIGLSFTPLGGPLIALLSAIGVQGTLTGFYAVAGNALFSFALSALTVTVFDWVKPSWIEEEMERLDLLKDYRFLSAEYLKPTKVELTQPERPLSNPERMKAALLTTKGAEGHDLRLPLGKKIQITQGKESWICYKTTGVGSYCWLQDNSLGITPGWYHVTHENVILFGGNDEKKATDPIKIAQLDGDKLAFQHPMMDATLYPEEGDEAPWFTIDEELRISRIHLIDQAGRTYLPATEEDRERRELATITIPPMVTNVSYG